LGGEYLITGEIAAVGISSPEALMSGDIIGFVATTAALATAPLPGSVVLFMRGRSLATHR
jgi:hypothetical protein